MTTIDGLTNFWDLKDCIIAIQDSQMRAQHLFDYTDRRVSKNIANKPGSTNSNALRLVLIVDSHCSSGCSGGGSYINRR
jgi:hypothetical protein